MKYLINADCYLVDDKGQTSGLVDPSFDLNFDIEADIAVLKESIKAKMIAVSKYKVIKETIISNGVEVSNGTVKSGSINYEAYFGITGKEKVIPTKK